MNKVEKNIDNSQLFTHYPSLLLEIGTEEIPASFLPDAIAKLKENAEKIFSEYRLSFQSIKTYATPRRITLFTEIDSLQNAAEREVWGPPVNAAFDSKGNPTKAAEAFARSNGVDIASLSRREKGKGTYVVALIKEEAQQTEEILPEILPKLILSLNFPKSMRWGNGSIRFARPVHWLFAMYSDKKVEFEIDGIKSSTTTRGHRFLSPATFEVKRSKTYINLLRNNFVILDPEERKKAILDGANKLALSINASLVEDAELLDHVAYLVEYPVPVLGTFPSEYLSLPQELLITVMKGHQKYFAIKDAEGRLVNYFIVISNTHQDNAETIKKGAERVIRARFEDARFYYDNDKKTSLKERLEGLKKVIYHDRLGSLYDKSCRIASIADFIADSFKQFEPFERFEQFKRDVHTATLLSKTDLISGIVGEFPELQGIIGSYYALNDGYSEEISKALAEQYLPAHSGDRIPETAIGAALSLSDKLDNIVSFFMLGLTPTGTEDPFALRRQALGIISILIKNHYNLNIFELLDKSLQAFELDNKEVLINDLIKFFEQRIEPLFQSHGYPLDSISAVMNFVKDKPLYTIKERLNAIQKLKEDPDYEPFLLAIKRVNNIAPKTEVPSVNSELFSQEEERILHQKMVSIAPEINSLIAENRYYDAIKLLSSLKESINSFFDKVLVMDKNEDIKQNRLSVIKNIQKLAFRIADFSKLS
jgi:glycyl-tRNA synthetase beta chain